MCAPAATVTDQITHAWLEIFADTPVLPDVPPIAQWVRDQGIVIHSENTTYQGEIYDFDRFPPLSRLLTAFFEDPDADELFLLKPVQSTFTTTLTFCIGWHTLFHGGNAIIALHTRDAGREKAKDEFGPLLRAIPALGQAEQESETESTTATFRFSTGIIRIGSGNTKSTLTGDPAAVVALDECELYQLIDGAHSINRARERLTGALNGGKLIAGSKPEHEAILVQDDRTRQWKVKHAPGSYLDAAYLSGSQLRYECPCPACGAFSVPRFENLRFDHCREAPLPGLAKEHLPPLDFDRVARETYWQCPHCTAGRVHEGPEKVAWVMAGRWVPTPTAERRGKECYANPISRRWSAQFSALTDIAFQNLRWGALVIKFLEAQGDSVALRAFRNGVLGLPQPVQKSEDTTLDQVRRLIPKPLKRDETAPAFYVPPWNHLDESTGEPSRFIPIVSSQLAHIVLCIDTQDKVFKFTVRAHAKDGTMPLIEYGTWPWTKEGEAVRNYIHAARFVTADGRTVAITGGLIDPKGRHWEDILALTVAIPILYAAAGEGRTKVSSLQAGPVWQTEAHRKTGSGKIPYFFHAANHWEDRLYEDCIQGFDPHRYRSYAPALWLPTDIGNDFLEEHIHMTKNWVKGKMVWEKTGPNDWGDCTKLHLIFDWLHRLRHLQRTQAQNAAKTYQLKGKPPQKPRPRIATAKS